MNIIQEITNWFKVAVPEPTDDNRRVQLGCHLEEVGEMVNCLQLITESVSHFEIDMKYSELNKSLNRYAFILKTGRDRLSTVRYENLIIADKTAFADALADQMITAIGLAYMNGIDIEGALKEVNRSNWSKFVGGE